MTPILMDGFEQYIAKIQERHEEVRQRWSEFLAAITGGQRPSALTSTQALRDALLSLEELLIPQARPVWLNAMKTHAQQLTDQNHLNNDKLRMQSLHVLLQHAAAMQAHQFDESSNEARNPLVSLDEVVAKHHDQDQINQLYDQAIQAIKEALRSGQIDSTKVKEDLRTILATIEDAKASSFINQRWQIPNLKLYLQAAAKVSAKKIPVLNVVLEIMEEVDNKLSVSNEQILKEMQALVSQRGDELSSIIEHQPEMIEHKPDPIDPNVTPKLNNDDEL